MNRTRPIAAAATAALIVAGIGPAVDAYGTYGKWGTLSVSFYVNPVNLDVSESAATSALQAAMNGWNTQSGTAFRYSYAGRVNDTTTGYDNKNVILFRNESSGSTIASTYSWSSNGVLVDSDIVFWDGGFKFFAGSSGCTGGAYIEDIASHELGHALGLQHSSLTDATMYASYSSCSQALRSLSADDIAGAQSLYADGAGVVDTAPNVTIASPLNGGVYSQSQAIAFSGSAIDVPDGNISSKLVWKSSINGKLGTGASFSKTLSAGVHTITATATDSMGHTIQRGILVTVNSTATNTAPTVTISSPANGASIASGATVGFSGSASDTQDGNITSKMVWRSSIDGQIGTGGSFSRVLTSGSHTITVTVADAGGLTAQKSITVTVASASTPPPPSGGATLSAKGYKVKGVQNVNLAWANLTATSVDVYRNGARVMTTSNSGKTTDKLNQKGGGNYTASGLRGRWARRPARMRRALPFYHLLPLHAWNGAPGPGRTRRFLWSSRPERLLPPRRLARQQHPRYRDRDDCDQDRIVRDMYIADRRGTTPM